MAKSKLSQLLWVCKSGTCFCAPFVSRRTTMITSLFRAIIFPSLFPLLICTHTLASSLPALFLFCNSRLQHLLLSIILDASSSLGFDCLPTHSLPSKSSPNEVASVVVSFLDTPSYAHLLEHKGEKSTDVLGSCTLPQTLKCHRREHHSLGISGNTALWSCFLKGKKKSHIEELLLLFPVLRNCI